MNNKIAINATNLHVGGGVQVASSFIYELSKLILERSLVISVFVSEKVHENILDDIDISVFNSYRVINTYGLRNKCSLFDDYDVLFTVFGPYYSFNKNLVEITGFAQPWICYPDNKVYEQLNIFQRSINRLSFKVKDKFFRKSDVLIVEADHVREALIAQGYKQDKIKVVNNTVSDVFESKNKWVEVNYSRSERFTLGFIGRNYIHKNIKRLKEVNKILLEKYDVCCDFVFTLTDDEMKENEFIGMDNFVSVGPIKVEQCPDFYNNIDALIFPSLLECFSATPIEAMKMDTLVIASKLPFIVDVCKDSARYFNPLDNHDIARAIYEAVTESNINKQYVALAKQLLNNSSTAKNRAISYLDIIELFKR
ncbi:glycosyltransferase [Vibrio breoganii]|uniref:glycosyltransferase n=1 Tax=Vibrio breoganii TaxID=553239 RepID=UPI000C84CB49|nr:glycosyltransferase [Vibrio breoganii]PMG95100.1 hypothetical protein BCU81_00070 [Vibrio breoganii]